jgi:hypothetical protein
MSGNLGRSEVAHESGGPYNVYLGETVNGTFDDYGLCASFTVTSAGTLQSEGADGMR